MFYFSLVNKHSLRGMKMKLFFFSFLGKHILIPLKIIKTQILSWCLSTQNMVKATRLVYNYRQRNLPGYLQRDQGGHLVDWRGILWSIKDEIWWSCRIIFLAIGIILIIFQSNYFFCYAPLSFCDWCCLIEWIAHYEPRLSPKVKMWTE